MATDILGKRKKTNKSIKGIARQWLNEKREEAIARQEAYDKLSIDAIVSALNAGNYRATKQRKKLAARLAAEEAAKVKSPSKKAGRTVERK